MVPFVCVAAQAAAAESPAQPATPAQASKADKTRGREQGADDFTLFRDTPALILKTTRAIRLSSVDVVGGRREDLATQPVTEMREALKIQPGVHMNETGGPVRTVFPTIRGSLPRHVRVMLDDIPLNSNDEGSGNVNLIPFFALDQMQVWKNGSSAVYGSGLGGVIQAKTIDPPAEEGVHGHVTNRYRTWGTTDSEGVVGLRAGKVGFIGAGSYQDSNGFRRRSGFYDRRGFGKLTYDLNENSRILVSGGLSEAFLEDFEYTRFDFWDHVNTVARYGQASLEIGRATDLEMRFTAYGFDHFLRRDSNAIDADLRLSRTEIGSLAEGGNAELNWTTRHRFMDDRLRLSNRFTLGFDVERDIVDTEDMADPIRYSKRGAFVRDTVASGRVSLTLGCRMDDSTAYGDYVSPEAGLAVCLPGDRVTLRANANRSWSAPPILWRYLDTPFFQGNEDIEAEKAVTYSAGFDVEFGDPLWVRASALQSSVDNALATEFITPMKRTTRNVDEHRRRGLELTLEHRFGYVRLRESAFWGRVEDRETHETVLGRVKRSYKVMLDFRHPKGWSAGVQGRYENWNQDERIEPDERHMIWDLRLGYAFTVEKLRAELFFIGRNVFDTDYAFNEFAAMPGASAEAGLRIEF